MAYGQSAPNCEPLYKETKKTERKYSRVLLKLVALCHAVNFTQNASNLCKFHNIVIGENLPIAMQK